MDYANCNVIYVDRRAQTNRVLGRDDMTPSSKGASIGSSYFEVSGEPSEVTANVQVLLSSFNQVHICTSGTAFRAKATALNQSSEATSNPTIVLIDIPPNESSDEDMGDKRPRSATSLRADSATSLDGLEENLYGTRLLRAVVSDIQYQHLSKLFVPVAVIASSEHDLSAKTSQSGLSSIRVTSLSTRSSPASVMQEPCPLDPCIVLRYLEAGAVDVVTGPLSRGRIAALATHAYRAHREVAREQNEFLAIKQGRKRSWVGVAEEKPYAYLREAMVSSLMDGICKPQKMPDNVETRSVRLKPARQDFVARVIGTWSFSAHELSDDELLHAALLILRHAMSMPNLERFRLSPEDLAVFLVATRTAYNSFVPYHNFRHVVDVLQATFYFLLKLEVLPAYPTDTPPVHPQSPVKWSIASLLRPFDALALLITAIGHDVGHPGVNNAFLVTLNAPLAQLYNDRSVLESFHCAAFSQILRRHWPAAFEEADMRKLLINSILATDMGLHFEYMSKLAMLQQTLVESGGTKLWDEKLIEQQRTLTCSILIKCADISNVARKYDVAAQWATILTDEFARQATMEDDLGIPSTLFAPPTRDSVLELGKSQIGFMNLFAIPLFKGATEILPAMCFTVDEMQVNKAIWEAKIEGETTMARRKSAGTDTNSDQLTLQPSSRLPSSEAQNAHASDPVMGSTMHSPLSSSRVSIQNETEDSRRSSQCTAGRNSLLELGQSRRSSLGPTITPDRTSDVPSPKFGNAPGNTQARPLRPQARRSSNTIPSQLQLGLTPLEGRRPSADHSLLAVLVTSSGRNLRPGDSTSIHDGRPADSEKGSFPPSHSEWQSQVTSPSNLGCSPTTPATSFLTEGSFEREGSTVSPPYSATTSGADKMFVKRPLTPPETRKSLRHRSSRWRLSFWKTRRRSSMEALPRQV